MDEEEIIMKVIEHIAMLICSALNMILPFITKGSANPVSNAFGWGLALYWYLRCNTSTKEIIK